MMKTGMQKQAEHLELMKEWVVSVKITESIDLFAF